MDNRRSQLFNNCQTAGWNHYRIILDLNRRQAHHIASSQAVGLIDPLFVNSDLAFTKDPLNKTFRHPFKLRNQKIVNALIGAIFVYSN